MAIILKDKELKDDVKLESKDKCADKIIAWIKNNVKYKDYISSISLVHIQKQLQSVNTDWLAYAYWEWLKKRYTFQNTASK